MCAQTVLAKDFTGEYHAFDAWMYENLFSPAVLKTFQPLLEEFCRTLPANAHVLDVGCGGGGMAVYLCSLRDDISITGIDLCPAQIRRALRTTQHIREKVRFEHGSALALPFQSSGFDAVISITAIKHWPSQEQGISECLRVLKPGGALFIGEVDRGARLETVRHLIRCSRTPFFLRAFALPLIRTFIFGQSCDLDDFRHLANETTLANIRVDRTPNMPGIYMQGLRT